MSVTSASLQTADGEVSGFQVEVGAEAGWMTGSAFIVVPPGESVTLVFELAGTVPLDDGYSLAVRPQPMVIDEQLSVSVVDTDGQPLVVHHGPSTRARVLGE